jgi:quinol monooxygenase YgiN
MSEVVVVAEIGIVPEKREAALAALRTLCEETHAKDEGCLLYALHLDPADDSHVFMLEKWASAEALATHGETDHIKALGTVDFLSGAPTVTVLEPTGFGDAELGAI